MTSPLQPQAKGSGISAHFPMGFVEFVAMIAGLMALNALAMDIMLPALPDIGSSLGVLRDNDRQAVLSVYMIGFGLGQFMIGSISDRFGRRTVLLSGLFVYIVTAGLCASAPSSSCCCSRVSPRGSPHPCRASLRPRSYATAMRAGAWRA